MILDKLENASLYFDCVPRFREFMNFFNFNDLVELPSCKIKLLGDDLFITISDLTGKDLQNCVMEAHRDYIDIHIPLTTSEQIGWRSQNDCDIIVEDYEEGKDRETYADAPQTIITIPQGSFAVFFPSDAHQLGINPENSYRKLLVKTKVEE